MILSYFQRMFWWFSKNFYYVWRVFHFSLWSSPSPFFSRSITHLFLCLRSKFLLSLFYFTKNRFLSFHLVMITLEISAFMNSFWFSLLRRIMFFKHFLYKFVKMHINDFQAEMFFTHKVPLVSGITHFYSKKGIPSVDDSVWFQFW